MCYQVQTEIIQQDGTIVLLRQAPPGDNDPDFDPDFKGGADALEYGDDDLVLSKDGTRLVRKRGRKRLSDIEKMTRFICKYCGKVCHFRKQLEEHELVHQGIKPWQCDQCQARFTKQANLITHQKIHTGVRPFMCEECPKSFVSKSQLVAHRRAHSDERPFQCDVCSKAFKDKSSLKMHNMTHTGEKPHV